MKYAALVLACAPVFAFAQSANTITFTGEVTQATCDVTINGASGSPIVRLPSVGRGEFSSSGVVKGWTKFDMALTGCSTTLGNFDTKFTPVQKTAAHNIQNTANPLTNVHLQLTSVDAGGRGNPVSFTSGSNTVLGGPLTGVAGSKTGSQSYGVEYISEGITTAGKVAGAVTYSFVYR